MRLPGKGLPEGLSPLTVALPADVFSATLIISLFLPVTLLLRGILNFDSSSCDCYLILPPICHLLGSTSVAKEDSRTVCLGHLRIWTLERYMPWTTYIYSGKAELLSFLEMLPQLNKTIFKEHFKELGL